MMNLSPLWWWLLPLLALPIWWHRQRRQTPKIHTLATAKFLPAAAPQLLRVWRWHDHLLLLLRCLMLLIMLALLAGWAWGWRGDTVLVANNLDAKWVQQQLQDTGFAQAKKMTFCADRGCDIETDNVLFWLEQQQAQWLHDARWLILAPEGLLRMSGVKPDLRHAVSIRIAALPVPAPAAKQVPSSSPYTIAIRSQRMAEWRRLFSSFEAAGLGAHRFVLSEQYDARASLVIWDDLSVRDANWRAPMIWQTLAATTPWDQSAKLPSNSRLQALQIALNFQLKAQIWTVSQTHDWPLQRIEDAKILFEAWQSVYASNTTMQAQDLKANPAAHLSLSDLDSPLQNTLLCLLILVFGVERSLAHVRRS